MNIKKLFLCILIFSCADCFAKTNQDKPVLYALDAAVLAHNKKQVNAGNATAVAAYRQLLQNADKALKYKPVSVMEKANLPPSGDKHDYMSLAPYFWPDSTRPGGMPYIRKDGQTNPEVKTYKDKEYFPRVCENIFTLSLAGYFSGEDKYATHASALLKVWFIDSATKMNPNLNFSQAIKGQNDGRGAGLIDSRHLIKITDAVQLLHAAKAVNDVDYAAMQNWFSSFLTWMQTSKNGIDELNAKNNHGVWYDAQRLSYAMFTGNISLAKTIVANAKQRLDKQMDNEGSFPAEMERTISLHYTVFVMNAFLNIAQMDSRLGDNFWNYESPSGKSLKKGFAKLQPYLLKEKQWAGTQIKDFDFEDATALLAKAAMYFNCTKCNTAVKNIEAETIKKTATDLLTQIQL